MKHLNKHIFIVSAFQASQDDYTNSYNHDMLTAMLDRLAIPFKVLVGHYKSRMELSVLIVGQDKERLVQAVARNYNQECYLESHGDRFTELVYTSDGRREAIGYLKNVENVEGLEAYSYCPETKQFFAVGA